MGWLSLHNVSWLLRRATLSFLRPGHTFLSLWEAFRHPLMSLLSLPDQQKTSQAIKQIVCQCRQLAQVSNEHQSLGKDWEWCLCIQG